MSIMVACGMVPKQVLLVTIKHPESIFMHVFLHIQTGLICMALSHQVPHIYPLSGKSAGWSRR